MNYIENYNLNSDHEVILNFPLERDRRKSKRLNLKNRERNDNENLERFYNYAENNKNEEWHQEYFLIYNSYVLENSSNENSEN